MLRTWIVRPQEETANLLYPSLLLESQPATVCEFVCFEERTKRQRDSEVGPTKASVS